MLPLSSVRYHLLYGNLAQTQQRKHEHVAEGQGSRCGSGSGSAPGGRPRGSGRLRPGGCQGPWGRALVEGLGEPHPDPPAPGVQPPRGEPGSDCGGGDGRAPCAGEGGDGEVPAEQGAPQQPEEGQGEGPHSALSRAHQSPGWGSGGGAGLDPVSFGLNWALTRPFLIDLLLLPNQVPAVLLAVHLSLLQEVSLL